MVYRKSLLIVVALIMMFVVSSTFGLAKTQVTFLNFFNAPELWEPFFKDAFEQFEQANPDIEVKMIFTPYGEMRQKLLTMAAGGTPPDLVSVPSDVAADYIHRGLLLPLNTYIEGSQEAKATFEDVYPARLGNYTAKGVTYGVPIDIGPNGVYYNMDLFDDAGLTYPEKGWTLEDMTEKARKLKNVAEWPFDFSRDPHRLYPLYAAYGGEPFYNDDLSEFQMASEKSIKALEQLAVFVEEGLSPTMAMQTAATQGSGGFLPFSAGKYGMSYEWIGQISYLHKPGVPVKRFDTSPLPKGANPVQISGGQGFAVVKGSKNPDAAWKVIEWFMSDSSQRTMAENGVWFPARISLGQYAIPKDGRPTRFLETFIETQAEYGYRPHWYVPGWAEARDHVVSALEGLWNGRYSAAEAANMAKDKVSKIKLTPVF